MSTPTTLIPYLSCRNATEALAFYQKAFGAETLMVMPAPDGKVMHAAMNLHGATVYLCDEFPEYGNNSPESLGGSPVTLHLQVADCDAVFAQATAAGCEVKLPLQEMFWGDRYGQLADPYGHRWSVATTVKQVTPEEMQKAMAELAAAGPCEG